MVAVGAGMAFPLEISASFPDEERDGILITAEARYSNEIERFVLHKLAVESTDPSYEITGTLLRALPVRAYHRTAGSELPYFNINSEIWSKVPAIQARPEDLPNLLAMGPCPETFAAVAKFYRLAEILGYRPAAHIQKVFGLPSGTASEWINRAREFFPTESSVKAEAQQLNGLDTEKLLRQARAFALGDR